jgi:hypothetical protein
MAGQVVGRPDELIAIVAAFMPRVSLGRDARQNADQDDEPEAEHREDGW